MNAEYLPEVLFRMRPSGFGGSGFGRSCVVYCLLLVHIPVRKKGFFAQHRLLWLLVASYVATHDRFFCARRFFTVAISGLQLHHLRVFPELPAAQDLQASGCLLRASHRFSSGEFNATGWMFANLGSMCASFFLHLPLLGHRMYVAVVLTNSDDVWSCLAWCMTGLAGLVPRGTMHGSICDTWPADILCDGRGPEGEKERDIWEDGALDAKGVSLCEIHSCFLVGSSKIPCDFSTSGEGGSSQIILRQTFFRSGPGKPNQKKASS